MLVLTSSKANIISEKSGYKDYIFYTDLRIDPYKFKILHSLEFVHESSDKYGLFHVYLLFGGSGEEYYIGSFFQEEKAKKISFSGAQQLHTIDNGSVTESVVTVRVYYTNFLSRSEYLAGHSVDLGTPSNYIPTLGNLDGTTYNAVAVGTLAFNTSEQFPFVTITDGSYIDFTGVCNNFGTSNRWTHGFRYRTTNTNVNLYSYRDTNGSIINIYIDENGEARMNGVGTRRELPFRHDDNVWRMLFVTPLDNVVNAHILYGDDQNVSFPSITMDITPSSTLESYIGATLNGTYIPNVPFCRYQDSDGTDSGTLGYDAAVTNGYTAFTQDGRTGGYNSSLDLFNLSAHVNQSIFKGNKFSVAYWYNSNDRALLSGDSDPNRIAFTLLENTNPVKDRFAIVHYWVGDTHYVKARLFSDVNNGENGTGEFIVGSGADDDGPHDFDHTGWHHIAVVIGFNDENTYEFKMYKDGNLRYDYHQALISRGDSTEYTLENTIANDIDRVYIGGWGGGFRNFEAAISDFQIYERVLSAKDVMDIYNGTTLSTGNSCDIAQIYSADKTVFADDRSKLYAEEGEYDSGELADWNLRLKIEQV